MGTALQLLKSLLRYGRQTSGDNHIFYCPICNHRKPKLEIDIKRGYWHCWVCDSGGKTFYGLLKWINAPVEYYDKFREIVKYNYKELSIQNNALENPHIIQLPSETRSLIDGSGFYYNAAWKYLKSRGIGLAEVIQYNIGYCTEGQYKNRLIIPSYDSRGKLNYFIGRDFMDSSELKVLNPKLDRNIIGFELFIEWSEPIVLVEGVFDALAVKYNAIPLFGKNISEKLENKLLSVGTPEIIVCLDSDALVNSIDIIQRFNSFGFTVKHCNLPDNTDPADIGKEKIWDYLNNSELVTENYILDIRVKNNIGYGKIRSDISYSRHPLSVISASWGI
jgi:transcription elongation factor Elf1